MTRTAFLREQTRNSVHKKARIAMPEDWSTANLDCSLAERKAYAVRMLLENMPLYIGERELLVGSRTVYGRRGEEQDEQDRSNMNFYVMPHYIRDEDCRRFGFNGEFHSKGHYTAGYEKLLKLGIDGIVCQARSGIGQGKTEIRESFLKAVIIAYEGLSCLIQRYAGYAAERAEQEPDVQRRKELARISEVCAHIAHQPPRDFWEAAQLFWFSHLSLLIENFHFMNYGRVDQFLYPYFQETQEEEIQQLVDCLLLKMYDGVDVYCDNLNTYSGQHNLTLGGVTPSGENAVNRLTYLFLDGLSRTRLPEPEVAVRVHSSNPPDFLLRCAALSTSGLNCIAYYHDDQFLDSLAAAGIPREAANDYGFDLCQDINIPGRGDFYVSGTVDLARLLLQTLEQAKDDCTFESFVETYQRNIAAAIQCNLSLYNLGEQAVREYTAGNESFLLKRIADGSLPASAGFPLMSPLPLTSALYEGCLESGNDVSWFGCELQDKGFMIINLVVAINSLAALRKRVFEEKRYALSQVWHACLDNYEGWEEMRQLLWTAPKWANDDDFVDIPAKWILEFACDEVMKCRTPGGARHLAGLHQPHPVFDGWGLMATPEGRKKGEPIPVTLSPENGTMLHGPTAAFRSAVKIDPMKYQWNNCVMLQYYASAFEGNEGPSLFCQLLRAYFRMGGAQHQPNVICLAELKAAQEKPEEYRNLIVRMWGVAAHFVNLPREVQDEFIARFENL